MKQYQFISANLLTVDKDPFWPSPPLTEICSSLCLTESITSSHTFPVGVVHANQPDIPTTNTPYVKRNFG